MQPSQLLIALLIAAHLSVDAVVFTELGPPRFTDLFALPPPISQVGLLALWAGLGRTPFWIRLPVLLAWAILWSWLLKVGGGIIASHIFLLLSIEAVLILSVLLMLRVCGVGVLQIDPKNVETALPGDLRFRFSLRDLFVLLTAACVCLAAMPWLVEGWDSMSFHSGREPLTLAFCELWAVLTLLAAWLALGARFAVLRGACCLLLVVGLASITLLDLEPNDKVYGTAWIMAEYLLLTYSSLLVLRLCGYRFVHGGQVASPARESPCSIVRQ